MFVLESESKQALGLIMTRKDFILDIVDFHLRSCYKSLTFIFHHFILKEKTGINHFAVLITLFSPNISRR